MDNKSLAHPGTAFVDESFVVELSELTGISYRTLNSAFTGERRDMALDTVKTIVAENLDATPAIWTEKLHEHAKAKGFGEYRPGYWDGYELTYEHNEHLRSIGEGSCRTFVGRKSYMVREATVDNHARGPPAPCWRTEKPLLEEERA